MLRACRPHRVSGLTDASLKRRRGSPANPNTTPRSRLPLLCAGSVDESRPLRRVEREADRAPTLGPELEPRETSVTRPARAPGARAHRRVCWVLHGKPIRLTTRGPANADEERRQLVGWILDEVAFPTLLVATWRVVGHFDGAMYHYWRLMCLARVKTWWREVTTIQLDRLSSVQAAKERARKVVAREHPSHLSVESGEPSRQPLLH